MFCCLHVLYHMTDLNLYLCINVRAGLLRRSWSQRPWALKEKALTEIDFVYLCKRSLHPLE